MRIPGLLAVRALATVGYAMLYASMGRSHPMLWSLAMNLCCVVVGLVLEHRARLLYVRALQRRINAKAGDAVVTAASMGASMAASMGPAAGPSCRS